MMTLRRDGVDASVLAIDIAKKKIDGGLTFMNDYIFAKIMKKLA